MKANLKIVAAVAAAVGLGAGLLVARLTAPTPAAAPEAAAAPTTPATPGTAPRLLDSLVSVETVRMEDVQDVVPLSGKLTVDSLRLQQISARVAGRVDRLDMIEGGAVHVSQPLAWIYSPDYISAQNELLLAKRTAKALQSDATRDLWEDAKGTLEGARNKLRILGASAQDVAELEARGVAQEYLIVTANLNGRILTRDIKNGGYLNVGDSLGSAADLSTLWFMGNVFESDLPRLKLGQTVDIQVAGAKSSRYQGKISFISPVFDPQTHAVNVRVDLPNPNGELRPEMFAKANVRIGVRHLPVVPRAAVVQDGAQSFVVVQHPDNSYARVPVSTQPANRDDELALSSGVQATDRVVVEGGVLVDRALVVNATRAASSAANAATAAGAQPGTTPPAQKP